ncbi:MAG: MarR family transcriptional regulator [Anaerolineae bacterium]|nr:MarR family transcriptional regulator [Anaerolineae bacterium]
MSATTHRAFEYIREHIRQHGFGPTMRELADHCYLSHSGIVRHIDRLEGMGWIQRTPGKARSIVLGPHAPAGDAGG